MYKIYTVQEDLWKHTLIVKPYYRLITITGPGLKLSKYIKRKNKNYNIY